MTSPSSAPSQETPSSTQASTTSPATPEPDDPWRNLLDQIGWDGVPPLQVALEAFAIAIGPLPGVETPDVTNVDIRSATGPWRWVLGYWDELSDEMRTAVAGYAPEPLPADAPSAAPASGVALLAATVPTSGVARAVSADLALYQPADCTFHDDLDELAGHLATDMGNALGRQLGSTPSVCVSSAPISLALPFNDRDGYTDGEVQGCLLLMPTDNPTQATLVGELFHCFAAELLTISDWVRAPSWILEGGSSWAAMEKAADLTDPYLTPFLDWFRDPTTPLLRRSGDAAGFFSTLDDGFVDPWALFDNLFNAWKSRGNETAYLRAVQSSEDLLDNWGGGYFARRDLQYPWFVNGPAGPTDYTGGIVREGTLSNGLAFSMDAAPYSAGTYKVDLQADIVILGQPGADMGLIWEGTSVVTGVDALELPWSAEAHMIFVSEDALGEAEVHDLIPRGIAAMSDGQWFTLPDFAGVALCTQPGGCACPAGSAGEDRTSFPVSPGEALFAVTGHTTGTNFFVSGQSIEDFCSVTQDARTDRLILAAGSWSWRDHGGIGVNGCPWPSVSASGFFEPDPANHVTFNVSERPITWRAYAHTNEEAGTVEVDECIVDGVRKYDGGELVRRAVVTWILPPRQIGAPPEILIGNTIGATETRGPVTVSWELSRRVAPLGDDQ